MYFETADGSTFAAHPAQLGPGAPQPALDAAEFARACRLIHARAGLSFSHDKRMMVQTRLAPRLHAAGVEEFKDYVALLEGDRDAPEWEYFVNALTNNLTSFFRESHHFGDLARYVQAAAGPVRVWSCAASTGEEAYSIAITLAETLGDRAEHCEIIATDIDTEALARARAGIYDLRAVEKLGAARCRQFFLKGRGARAAMARVKPALRARVRFSPLNVAAVSWPSIGAFDVIFCRNLMIYFDAATQERLLRRFATALKPGGLLFAGHSENYSQLDQPFVLRGQTVYALADRKPRQ